MATPELMEVNDDDNVVALYYVEGASGNTCNAFLPKKKKLELRFQGK